ncbi:MAG: hypothetical protein ABR910_00850 [Acidobacteriaceae bacterium]
MRFFPRFGGSECLSGGNEQDVAAQNAGAVAPEESHLLKTVGLVSAALGAVAVGLIVGREIRRRYKFNRRTPYDLYSHSGDELADADWGVGI